VSTIEELLEGKISGCGLGNREHGRKDPSRWPFGTLYPQKLALTSAISGGRSVGIVRSLTKATEFSSAIPVAGHGSLLNCETSRIPRFVENRLTDGVSLSVLRVSRALPFPTKIPDTNFCWLSKPHCHSVVGRIRSIKRNNPVTFVIAA
jgi:hypothetical protein